MDDRPVSINLRLPRQLHAALRELASRDRRSLNAEIVHLLEQITTTETGRVTSEIN